MPVFRDPKKLAAYLKQAADALQAETIITTQAQLGSKAISPYETGRFRSSWFAAEGTSSDEVAPEGTDSPNTDANGLQYDTRKTYHLTNNLSYAQTIAIEGKVVSQETTWFKDFREARIPKIQNAAGAQVKREFDL